MEEQNQQNEDAVVAQKLIEEMTNTIGRLYAQNIELNLRLNQKDEIIAQMQLERDIVAHQEQLQKELDHE
uniref:Uncharacterized protein n=1 Tax=Siphoviridae sp. ctYBm1 TaxID=2826374 RepID=A0A8S5LS34_9CAUD|nr:MAG TPA: hypothetical protein [Siphoviridae sp. ctYBm1]